MHTEKDFFLSLGDYKLLNNAVKYLVQGHSPLLSHPLQKRWSALNQAFQDPLKG